MKEQFCSLRNEEMMMVDGGKSILKATLFTTTGSVLVANCVLVGALVTPVAGVVALGTGLTYIGKGLKEI